MSTNRGTPLGSTAAALSISTRAFDLVRELIESRIGLHYPPDRAPLLADKLTELAARHGVSSYLDLYYLLRYDEDQAGLWSEVADHLSVPETFFWRQPEQIRAAVALVEERLAARGGRARIWSAACCSGEEPLSIAMALDAAGVDLGRVEIVASDASPRMLERARAGRYSDRSTARLPDELKARYLTRAPDGWRVDPKLHDAVRWRLLNLAEATAIRPLAASDIIFCRNVFIYFSDETIRRVVAAFEEAMPEDGVLFLGAAESLVRLGGALRLQQLGDAFVYRKGEPGDRPAPPPAAARPIRSVR